MSSMCMSKKETIVLFDLLKMSDVPFSVIDMPHITQREYVSISKSFYETGAVSQGSFNIRPDKNLDQFLLPIKNASQILLFNYGDGKKCIYNVSVYFSKDGITSVKEIDKEILEFLHIENFGEFLLSLPLAEDVPNDKNWHISFTLLHKQSCTIHCATFDAEDNSVTVREAKRNAGEQNPTEEIKQISVSQYAKAHQIRLKEIYNNVPDR